MWECIHLKPQDLLTDAYWNNRAWMLDLEWSAQAVLVVTSLISSALWMESHPQITALESNKSCVCVCVCVSCLSVSVCVLEMNPLLE